MLLRYFYDKQLAQASYLVGCAKTGEALVVDPSRNLAPYLQAAQDEGLRITHVTETHIHADYVSGSRELAATTGATLFLSDMGTPDWKYTYNDGNVVLLHDGDSWMVGNIRVEVLHTPGHTPEHISFMITDTAGADKPMGIFTGDFIFVGDVGRPDLLEEAAGFIGTKEPGARQQFASVQRFKSLPDYLQIWPAHGAGSACGKALGAVPSTTLGYEKLFNPAFQFDDEEAFVGWLLEGQPEAPRYFAQMKKVNKIGPDLQVNAPLRGSKTDLQAALKAGELILDVRSREAFAQSHIPATLSIPYGGGFSTYVGWFVDYEHPTHLIVADESQLATVLLELRAIGVDNIPMYFVAQEILSAEATLPQITAVDLAEKLPQNGLMILDVRGKNEYDEKHIQGARHIPLGYLPRFLDTLPQDRTIVTQCASGYRSQIAASYLRNQGFTRVINLSDGIETWSVTLPIEA